ncbi:hypothetical protein RB653_000190 [Dictyostelium firmibasis]|uniref:Uncharacterized protein n=1 Tax=Dictyostelium firmibasis TaxID=79012 RepID=A0AAN7YXQ1_9MYCE
MKFFQLLLISIVLSIYAVVVNAKNGSGKPLFDYVQAYDPHYNWNLKASYHLNNATFHVLSLTTQKWLSNQDTDNSIWKHWLTICIPDGYNKKSGINSAFLFIDGKNNNSTVPGTELISPYSSKVCIQSNAITADLTQIPNQPITFKKEGIPRIEDAFLGYTFRAFLNDSRDPTVLGYLPMVKAAVRAMDAVQEFGKTRTGNYRIKDFVVSGLSKRGWATWLTGAVDKRVSAIIPVVMPIPNMVGNIGQQMEAYGDWSFALADYVAAGVPDYLYTPLMTKLANIVDPLVYFNYLTMPKLVVLTTGDEFFLSDSTKYFWSQLKGKNFLRIVPNTNHYILNGVDQVVNSMSTFFDYVTSQNSIPSYSWGIDYSSDNSSGTITLNVDKKSVSSLISVVFYSGTTISATKRDFRMFTCSLPTCYQPIPWIPTLLAPESSSNKDSGSVYKVTISKPASGWTGFFIEASFATSNGKTSKFTSEIAIVPNKLPFPPCGDACKVGKSNIEHAHDNTHTHYDFDFDYDFDN